MSNQVHTGIDWAYREGDETTMVFLAYDGEKDTVVGALRGSAAEYVANLESSLAQSQADVEVLRKAIAQLGNEWDNVSIHQEIHTTSLGWFIRLCREAAL